MAYKYVREITIDKDYVGATLTNIPVCVQGTLSYLKTTANGGELYSASGYDVSFYSDAALTQKIPYEVQEWNGTTGKAVYWVLIPSISAIVNTKFYMVYANTSISTPQEDPVSTWSPSYSHVFHFKKWSSNQAWDSVMQSYQANSGPNISNTAETPKSWTNAINTTNNASIQGSSAAAETMNVSRMSCIVKPTTLVNDVSILNNKHITIAIGHIIYIQADGSVNVQFGTDSSYMTSAAAASLSTGIWEFVGAYGATGVNYLQVGSNTYNTTNGTPSTSVQKVGIARAVGPSGTGLTGSIAAARFSRNTVSNPQALLNFERVNALFADSLISIGSQEEIKYPPKGDKYYHFFRRYR